jgi:aminoglycoside phosphotransferase (APT) family kinase protein
MTETFRAKVEATIGSIKTMEVLAEQGWTSEVRRVITEDRTYLLKSAFKPKYRTWLKAEATVLEKQVTEQYVPVPTYYNFIEENDSSHLLMSFEKGMTLTKALREAQSLEEKTTLIQSFGQFLHNFHKMKPLASWQRENDWLEEQFTKAEHYVSTGQTEGSADLLKQLKSTKQSPVQQTMIHGDCTTDNVFVIDGEVKMFIDVAGMTIGDPRYDEALAIGSFDREPAYMQAFYEGYTRYKVSEKEYQYFEGLYEFF